MTMDDGAVLLADRWVPRATRDEPQPTVLVRSPYGRRQVVRAHLRPHAGRARAAGASSRACAARSAPRASSPVRRARRRAGDAATGSARSPGTAERIALVGPSYLGLVQWAAAPARRRRHRGAGDPGLRLAVPRPDLPAAAASRWRRRPRGWRSWPCRRAASRRWRSPARSRGCRSCCTSCRSADLDTLATGAEVRWFREAMASPRARRRLLGAARLRAGASRRSPRPCSSSAAGTTSSCPGCSRTSPRCRRRAARRSSSSGRGRTPRRASSRRACARRSAGCARTCSATTGSCGRSASASASPASASATAGGRWRAGRRRAPASGGCGSPAGGRLPAGRAGGRAAARDGYRYDPAAPDAVARRAAAARAPAGRRQRAARGAPRRADVHDRAAGAARRGDRRRPRGLHVRASAPHFDLFARVCDVDRAGVVAQRLRRAGAGLARSASRGRPTASWRVAFDLWPMGHRFAAGHRIRLQVSSGAHPRYARNPGTGEDPMHRDRAARGRRRAAARRRAPVGARAAGGQRRG